MEAQERRAARENALELATKRARELENQRVLLRQSAAKDEEWEGEREDRRWDRASRAKNSRRWDCSRNEDEVEMLASPDTPLSPDSLDGDG